MASTLLEPLSPPRNCAGEIKDEYRIRTMTAHKTNVTFCDELAPMGQFINGEISLGEFRRWLDTMERNHAVNISSESHLIRPEEQAHRGDAVRQANASVMLEGFVISPEIAWLNERYIRGEITLEQKGAVVRKMCGIE